MAKIIYLTGAPATGKSTLTENLKNRLPKTNLFTYSKELLKFIKNRDSSLSSQDDLRSKSAGVITWEDVREVDNQLLELANSCRGYKNLIIDSHPVTIEKFGFRVTSFTKEQLRLLNPDIIVCLYAESKIIANRIKTNSAGRPLPSLSAIDLHTQFQCQVASMYAFETSASLYYLDASHPQELLLENFLEVTGIE